jgi:hypothetical protein
MNGNITKAIIANCKALIISSFVSCFILYLIPFFEKSRIKTAIERIIDSTKKSKAIIAPIKNVTKIVADDVSPTWCICSLMRYQNMEIEKPATASNAKIIINGDLYKDEKYVESIPKSEMSAVVLIPIPTLPL